MTEIPDPFQRHPKFRARVDHIGDEKAPLLVIDNFLAGAETLVNFAAEAGRFSTADAFYPGVRAPAPDLYLTLFRHHLAEWIYPTFDLAERQIRGAQADFSMVLTPPDQLKPQQSMPHYDSNKSTELAAVHFLCGSPHGGTGFYRHRSTGYEQIDQHRVARYKATLAEEAGHLGAPQQCYMNGSNDHFERIASYDAVFNRVLIYRCVSLHSGNISEDSAFDPNPRNGRLTLNTFIFCHN